MTVINMECRAGMMTLPDNSVDAIVTDPPYGLSKEPDMAEVLRHWLAGDDYDHGGSGFMGKSWDSFVPGPATWREALRVLKPGGHALVFAGSRTQDLMTMALRLAGFEIRDTAMWLYGSGFPKSLDVGKKVLGYEGYGTALKPAYEPIIIARKPLAGTIAATVLKHGTGALNIGKCRVGSEIIKTNGRGAQNGNTPIVPQSADFKGKTSVGRWPANILHDGLAEEWSRYFYCAKTSKADRNAGAKNSHPTVKPTELMRWCCRLVGHPSALILDPFTGSGSTGRGARLEGFNFIGFEMDAEYAAIANARINEVTL